MTGSRRIFPIALMVLSTTLTSGALAAPVPPGFGAAAAAPGPAPALAEADAALEAGEVDRAAALYEGVVRGAPDSAEAAQARRALKILAITRARSPSMAPRRSGGAGDERPAPRPEDPAGLGTAPATPLSAASARPASSDAPLHVKGAALADALSKPDVVNREVPYSTRTKERLRLTVWEKVDFGVTSFLYGLSVGFSFGLSNNDHQDDDLATPAALGASLYTAAAVAYLSAADPDRGDLPLALAIGSYLPTSTLLVSNILYDNPNDKKVALAVATTGLLAIPIAVLATRTLDLDPGDTQLVRDAGFWGLLLASTATLAWGGREVDNGFGNTYRQDPSSRRLSVAGALGLYGGLGLGALAAANSEISLERVRVSTWGGYGGGLLGLLIGSGSGGKSENAWAGVTIGALLGLVVTFAATGSLDGIPPETTTVAAARAGRRRGSAAIAPSLSPSIVPVSVAGGTGAIPTLGFSGTL